VKKESLVSIAVSLIIALESWQLLKLRDVELAVARLEVGLAAQIASNDRERISTAEFNSRAHTSPKD
jgi:hypothetical protein